MQFWSEIIPVISNRTRAALSFDFEITHMISGQIALHSVQLPLLISSSCIRCHQRGLWQLIELIISLYQLCFDNFLQTFASPTPAKTMAFVPLSRLERATFANANLDIMGPTVNLVMPHLTLLYLYITFRDLYGCTQGCLVVCA